MGSTSGRVLALAGLIAATAAAQERALDISDLAAPAFTVYTEQDGLSDEIWSTVGFDGRGFAWAGSASSLARFDGYRWTPQPFPAARSLVRDLQLDGDGLLWAIFEREGLARYDGRAWALHDPAPIARHRFSALPGADGKPELWVGHDHGFLRLADGAWRPDAGDAGLVSGMPAGIERTATLFGAPREWMGSLNFGLWWRTPGSSAWQRFHHPDLPELPITDLVRTEDRSQEELWLTSYGGGLARLRDDGVRLWRSATGELPSEAMYNALATTSPTGDRLLWIATRGGLLRVHGDNVTAYDRRHGLPSDAVRSIAMQRTPEGTDLLWLATEGGIVRASLAPSQWRTVSLHGARENGTFGLLLEPDGHGGERLWVGSMQQGLALLEQGRWRVLREAAGLPITGIRSLWRVRGPDGRDWSLVGLHGGHVLRVETDLRMTPMPVPWPKNGDEALVHAGSREAGGAIELWFTTQRSGVQRLRDGRWTRFDAPDGKPWVVYSTAPHHTPDGRDWLWAASDRGLARFDGGAWHWLAPLAGLPADSFRQATLIPRLGRVELWASSYRNGVVRLDVTDPATPVMLPDAELPPVPDPTVYSVLADSRGRVYLCTNNGVQQLTPRDDGSYAARVFRRRDGLVHDECNTNSQRIDRHDRYWVGTLGGLSVFDPSLRVPATHTVPRPLHFTAARIDGALQPLGEGPLRLAPGTRELRIDFTLLSALRENESEYRSQLVGYDPEPTAWSPERSRSFTGLPPGAYRLQLQGRDYAGTESPQHELAIVLAPYWWQRGDVRLALGLGALALAASAVLLWNRNLRLRQRQLQRVVAERTRELHAANERLTELSYLDPLTGLANRRRLTEALALALQRAAATHRPLALIVIDVDHFKRYNDRHGHLVGDTALRAVAQALADAAREQDVVARFGGEEFACLMPDAGRDTAARVAERMRALVEALPPRAIGNDEDSLTISAGFVGCVPAAGDTANDLLQRADAALYTAKRDGRNRVREA